MALAAVLLAVACDQVNFTAPTGSTITITAEPPTVASNGFSNITVTGTRANGAPLPDGTVITFTVNLGTITDNPVETRDGVATTRFRAGTRSGTATVTARSGEAAEVTTEIIIGEARPTRLLLVANPPTLPFGGGRVQLRAQVTDDSGNALGGIGVIFRTTTGRLDSGSRVIRTNDSGLAFDRLSTNIDSECAASTNNGTEGTVTIDVAPGEGPDECSFTVSPSDPTIDEPIFFTDTSNVGDGPAIVQSLWDFGDGTTAEGLTTVHSYSDEGTFTVVHTVIDSDGRSTICTQDVVVVRGEPICTFTFNPLDPEVNEIVFFDASASDDPDGFIVTYKWDFGDGTTITETDPTIPHSFSSAQTFTVVLTVTDDDGNQKVCTDQVFVSNP